MIAGFAEADPDKMKVIRHAGVNRATQLIATLHVEQKFPKVSVETFIQPTCSSAFRCIGPKNISAAPIGFYGQARQLVILSHK